MSKFDQFNRVNAWNHFWEKRMGKGQVFAKGRCNSNINTYEDISKLLQNYDNINSIEDWGCGSGVLYCHLNDNLKKKYTGVDGSIVSKNENKDINLKMQVNLIEYTSSADVITMRHVFEHNAEYDKIFNNALKSFNKLLVIVFFTKLTELDKSIKYTYYQRYPNWENKNIEMADLAINKNYLLDVLKNNNFSQDYNEKKAYTFINNLGENGNETILIVKK